MSPLTREARQEAARKGALVRWKNYRERLATEPKTEPKKEPKEPKTDPKQNQQTQAVQARWAAERGSEEEVIHFFRKIKIEDGLELLARMRENCKHASLTLNARITADNNKDRCEFCGGPKKSNKQWALVRPYRDPVTLLPMNHFFCSIECVALMNRRSQGVYGVSDRGMLPEMNPQFHPDTKEVKTEPENHPEVKS